jgi:hypothetical protein
MLEQLRPGMEYFDMCEKLLRDAMDKALKDGIQVTQHGRLPKQDEARWNELVAHLGMVVDPTHNIIEDHQIRFAHKSDVARLKAEAKRANRRKL